MIELRVSWSKFNVSQLPVNTGFKVNVRILKSIELVENDLLRITASIILKNMFLIYIIFESFAKQTSVENPDF